MNSDKLKKLIEASNGTALRRIVSENVAKHFKSMHYLSSKLLCNAIVLNILTNSEITPDSADKILTQLHRETRSFYANVEYALKSTDNDFNSYAREVLGSDYNKVVELDLRTVNLIVYVISLDVSKKYVNKDEIYLKAYSYEDLINKN